MTTGIYAIENIRTGACYVGATRLGLWSRWFLHRSNLIKRSHYNQALQMDWNRHGSGWFKCVLLEAIEPSNATALREQAWIDRLTREGHSCYNLLPARERPLAVRRTSLITLKNGELMFTIIEVADFLKVKVSTVRTLIRKGELQAGRVGHNYRISREALRDYMMKQGLLREDEP